MTEETMQGETTDSRGGHDRFWLQLASSALSASSTYFDTNVRNRMIQDIRAFQNQHPEGSKYLTPEYLLKSKLFRPKTRAAIRKNEAVAAAAFFASEDVVSVRGYNDNDPMHQAAAEYNKALLQYRLSKPQPHGIPWFLTCMGAYQEAQTLGIVCSHQDWLVDKDRPEVRLLPVENVHFDPAADWRDVVGTSPYLIIEWPMYLRDVKKRMRDGRWRTWSDGDIISAGRTTADTLRLQREGKGTDSKDAGKNINEFTVVWVHEVIVRVEDVDVVYFTLGRDKMLSEPMEVTERYPQGRPLTIGFSIIEAHKTYPSSVPELTRPLQTEINDVTNERRHAVRLSLEKRYIVKKGRGVDTLSLTRNIPASVTLAESPNEDVRVVTTDDPTATAYQEQDRLANEMDDLLGVFSGSSVAAQRNLHETVGGMSMLSESANMVSEYQLRTFSETWVEPVLRQLILLERHYESDEMVMMIAGQAAGIAPEMLRSEVYDALLMQDVILTVAVGTGTTNPSVQLERFAYGLKLVTAALPEMARKLKPKEVTKEIFAKCGYKDGARFFDLGNEEEIDPRIEQLTEQLKMLEQRLLLKEAPELTAAKVAKADAERRLIDAKEQTERVSAMLKRAEVLFSSIQAGKEAVLNAAISPVADEIAASAGFEDQNAAPVIPATSPTTTLPPGVDPAADLPGGENTSPLFPPRVPEAGAGMMTGIEGGNG